MNEVPVNKYETTKETYTAYMDVLAAEYGLPELESVVTSNKGVCAHNKVLKTASRHIFVK